jgi:hypothetical protein
MLETASQFAPSQLLESGRRAEADGRIDLAALFYRHLTEHYPNTSEAGEARSGLGRIGGARPDLWQGALHGDAWRNRDARGVGGPAALGLPAPRNHYRVGRSMAAALSAFGWLEIALGCAAFPALFLPGRLVPYDAPLVTAGAAGLVLSGIIAVFVGQFARAFFDQACATQELVAIERAKVGWNS